MNIAKQLRRRKCSSALLLLSVICFSFGTSAHWLWHVSHDSCRETAHSCQNESLGNRSSAWQLPAHQPVNFDRHGFDCPVCSGLLTAAEVPESPQWRMAESAVLYAVIAQSALENFRKFPFAARAPPAPRC